MMANYKNNLPLVFLNNTYERLKSYKTGYNPDVRSESKEVSDERAHKC